MTNNTTAYFGGNAARQNAIAHAALHPGNRVYEFCGDRSDAQAVLGTACEWFASSPKKPTRGNFLLENSPYVSTFWELALSAVEVAERHAATVRFFEALEAKRTAKAAGDVR